ncbi:hypothetical protein A6A19_08050 [Actinobacillus delphinicola]|uniref:isochorismate synthase n=1 Tax=Actinobacillus delphinicola TaxID=51161 RepID=UPI0024412803|nr:isochorismate synthase [Actinobacillus delphinicola]MDG6897926.1 hypothetical protein [Actinobacillus delphinicola]
MLSIIKQAILSKLEKLDFNSAPNIAVIRLTQMNFSLPLLNWLKAQLRYPQFYLHYRDKTQHCVALGSIKTFTDSQQAEVFCQKEDLPLVGGRQFTGETFFFLPRLLLEQKENSLSVSLFVDVRANRESEIQQTEQILQNFTQIAQREQLPKIVKELASEADEATWCNWVEQACHAIQEKQFTKVVLANAKSFQTESVLNPYDFLSESEAYNQHCYHFLFAKDNTTVFLGSTPERLFLRQNSKLFTEALAGTAFVSEDEEETQRQADWLFNDEKNRHENQLVVENIQQSLQNVVKTFEVGERQIKRLRKVQHLQRPICGELIEGQADASCLQKIHPTAAVAGLPKSAAMQFINQIEGQAREWYAGTLGVMTKLQSEFCVTIRSANIRNDIIQVFAGAGIVEGSIPAHEWREIERKALGLVSLLEMKKE